MLAAVFALDEEHLIDLFICTGCLLGGFYFLVTGAYAVAAALFGSFIGGVVGFLVSGWPSQHDHDLLTHRSDAVPHRRGHTRPGDPATDE